MSRQLVKRQGSGDEADINLTPMLDVVFIMLIFFIVTATFIKPVSYTHLTLPTNREV